ncbi:MAG: histidine--tRNA ligase [Verrucomicrobiales bacterium]|nr:histidine--tRNA ligase [Verrucomicrobiales bacterium]
MASFRTVKGFRDFFPEDCALRNYVFETWRRVARQHGFVEYEGPVVESTDLFRKKSGDEITSQLFCFEDKGGREVSLRPEVTPSLARLAAARQRDYKKPLKWFQIGSCFRYEEPQEGRSREFIQFNADILGDDSSGADAELVALALATMRAFGVSREDFIIRLSDRRVWTGFLETYGIPEAQHPAFLQVIDKIERARPEDTAAKLRAFDLSLETVRDFMASTDGDHPVFADLRANLQARGLWDFVRIDASIVRGLAYYTGTVFEVFDTRHGLRAIAGGGRYDNLCGLLSDGKASMPAAGFAMGDVTLGLLLKKTPGAQIPLTRALEEAFATDLYVVIADETQRPAALALVQQLRDAGLRVEYPFSALKVARQFQTAEEKKARYAIVVGAEHPHVSLKNLISRSQEEVEVSALLPRVRALLDQPLAGHLLA